jgi:hypothetical protein
MTVANHRARGWLLALLGASAAIALLTVGLRPMSELLDRYRNLRTDEVTRNQRHFYDLTRAAMLAAGSPSVDGVSKGAAAAEELAATYPRFPQDTEYGNAIHYSNLVLGRIALAAGNVAGAKSHLLKAGKTPGSPQLDAYGPDMTLAQEMLNHGEVAVVLEYLSDCDKFWLNRDGNRVAEWSEAIRAGRLPDFGKASGVGPVASAHAGA